MVVSQSCFGIAVCRPVFMLVWIMKIFYWRSCLGVEFYAGVYNESISNGEAVWVLAE